MRFAMSEIRGLFLGKVLGARYKGRVIVLQFLWTVS